MPACCRRSARTAARLCLSIGPRRLRLALDATLRHDVRVAAEAHELAGDHFRRASKVHHPRGDRALRHAAELRRARLLGDGDAALGLDRPEALGPVGAGAGQHDADGALLVVLGERSEEGVDRQVKPASQLPRDEREDPAPDGEVSVGGDDVDAVRLHRHAVRRLDHRSGVPPSRTLVSMLGRSGSRCWITTKAMPESAGRRPKSCRRASSPPAEAPIPTTGNVAGLAGPAETLPVSAARGLVIRVRPVSTAIAACMRSWEYCRKRRLPGPASKAAWAGPGAPKWSAPLAAPSRTPTRTATRAPPRSPRPPASQAPRSTALRRPPSWKGRSNPMPRGAVPIIPSGRQPTTLPTRKP